jgi:fibronectin type 3 domain-containing protein
VTLSGTGMHDVILSWTASTTAGVMGYNIYRGTTPGGEGSTPLNPTPLGGTTFVDGNVTAGATYYYVVTALAQLSQLRGYKAGK